MGPQPAVLFKLTPGGVAVVIRTLKCRERTWTYRRPVERYVSKMQQFCAQVFVSQEANGL
jgi:hypothetical protein